MTSTTTHPTPGSAGAVQRVNPTSWSAALGRDQGQLRFGATAILTIGGQGPLDGAGRLLHEDDIDAQLALALANVEAVLAEAGMTPADLAQVRIHVTDIDAALGALDVVTDRLAELGATPPTTVVEVRRLAIPGMSVEIDAIAVR